MSISGWEEQAEDLAHLVVMSMATYVVVTDRIPDFQDWVKSEMLTNMEDEAPEVKRMYQKISTASEELIAITVRFGAEVRRSDIQSKMERTRLSWLMGPR